MTIQQQTIILTTSCGSNDVAATPTDIMCGRGKAYAKNRGNIHYLARIRSTIQEYLEAKTSLDRTDIIASLLHDINNSGARFIKKDPHTKEWYIMAQDAAHDKIGHSIRDMIARSKRQNKNKKTNNNSTTLKRERQTTTVAPKVCLEPICHRSNTFVNHDLTNNFSESSIDLLTNSLSLHQLIKSDYNNEASDDATHNTTESHNSKWDIITTTPQQENTSVCMTKMFHSIPHFTHDLSMTDLHDYRIEPKTTASSNTTTTTHNSTWDTITTQQQQKRNHSVCTTQLFHGMDDLIRDIQYNY